METLRETLVANFRAAQFSAVTALTRKSEVVKTFFVIWWVPTIYLVPRHCFIHQDEPRSDNKIHILFKI